MKQITYIVTFYEFSDGRAPSGDKLFELIDQHYISEWKNNPLPDWEGAGWDHFVEECGPLAESSLSWHRHIGRFLRKLMRLGAPKPEYVEWNNE